MSTSWLNFIRDIFHLLQNTISLVQLQKMYKLLLVITDVNTLPVFVDVVLPITISKVKYLLK